MSKRRDAERTLRVGVIANEFFDPATGGGYGGFGWAVRQLSRAFADPAHGVEVVHLPAQAVGGPRLRTLHGADAVAREANSVRYLSGLRRARIDLLVSIDSRPSYRTVLRGLPGVPLLVWVRDPWSASDRADARGLRGPDGESFEPAIFDCSAVGRMARRRGARAIALASPAPNQLRQRAREAYDGEIDELPLLPNPVDLDPARVVETPRPSVLFIARPDPIKRPWVFVELARRRPDADFIVLGQANHDHPWWPPLDPPPNLSLLGHIDGAVKERVLSGGWVTVNTSVHEGLATAYLESLACETPVICFDDPEAVGSRFGRSLEPEPGDGMAAVPRLLEALDSLLGDSEARGRLGREGRAWVREVHSPDAFRRSFTRLAGELGVAEKIPA